MRHYGILAQGAMTASPTQTHQLKPELQQRDNEGHAAHPAPQRLGRLRPLRPPRQWQAEEAPAAKRQQVQETCRGVCA